jgi:hypothetical protein
MKTLCARAGKLPVVSVCTGLVANFLFPGNPSDFGRCLILQRPGNEIQFKSATITQESDVSQSLEYTLFFESRALVNRTQLISWHDACFVS